MGKPRVGDADNEERLAAKLAPLLLAGTVATSRPGALPATGRTGGRRRLLVQLWSPCCRMLEGLKPTWRDLGFSSMSEPT